MLKNKFKGEGLSGGSGVKRTTLGFSSGHDLRVVRWSPTLVAVGLLSLCPFPCSLSLKINK